MRVPPGRGEAIEVGDFGGIDGGASGAVAAAAGKLGRQELELVGVLGGKRPEAERESGERS